MSRKKANFSGKQPALQNIPPPEMKEARSDKSAPELAPKPSVPSGIRDNLPARGSVGDFLREKILPEANLAIVSAYFTINAYEKLKPQLDAIAALRFLFGEPDFINALDPSRTEKKAFQITDDGITLANKLEQKRIARECAEWIQTRVEIRSIKRAGFLHGKMYHISNRGIESAILGSSNFTVHGLGLGANGNNIELNLIVDSERDRQDLKAWFNELWNDQVLTQDVKADVLKYLAQLYKNHDPEFIYYKTLYHIFNKFVEEQTRGGLLNEKTKITETGIWNALFKFQQDGAKGAINKILAHNGCILADSVGLGKTYTALAVIKYFELLNQRVLVLCPKKLRDNWTIYLASVGSTLNPFPQDKFNYTVLSHTDLSREGGMSGNVNLANFNWGAYDLVVIDESHNFRNNTPGTRDENGNLIRPSRYQRLMDDIIKRGVKTQVLMLTATPVNTDLTDLRNQIAFITEDRDNALLETIGIESIKSTLGVAQQKFNAWAKEQDHKTDALIQLLSSAFFKLLDELTIARSRNHIKRYYKDSIAAMGGFPERAKPQSEFPGLDLAGKFIAYDELNDEISNYKLSLFYPSQYVLPEYRAQYEKKTVLNFSQQDRERFLIGMMKVNFMKRLESSIESFEITMGRTRDKIGDLQERIAQFKTLRAQADINLDELFLALEEDDDLRDALEVGKKFPYQMAHLDLDRWLRDLKKDQAQIEFLYSKAGEITPARDAKLAALKALIAAKANQPTTNKHGEPNKKVLVFTAFADTASYLYDQLMPWAHKELGLNVALVTGGSGNKTTYGKNEFSHILTHFSPRSKQRAKLSTLLQDAEIDLLIATDCISEGQNLQDCDYLVNYDIHWNPVRVIQRFGRIDRIGSQNQRVHLVNFWPTPDLDKYIALKSRVEARMALVDIAATNEDNVLNTEQIRDLATDDLKYRDKQLLRLQNEILDLEDFDETVKLSDFTLDDFRADLADYLRGKENALRDAPFGLYTVVPPDPRYKQIQPGVIFCLQQRGQAQASDTINPLQPYFLVYVLSDGTVRYTFAQPKQLLEMYRALCSGKGTPYDDLCALFDTQTRNGEDLSHYSMLLERTVASIARTFSKRVAGTLQSGRTAFIPVQSAQATTASDYELVTWLVIL